MNESDGHCLAKERYNPYCVKNFGVLNFYFTVFVHLSAITHTHVHRSLFHPLATVSERDLKKKAPIHIKNQKHLPGLRNLEFLGKISC
jgi:hypothetical protein